jgi:hypothetical protein
MDALPVSVYVVVVLIVVIVVVVIALKLVSALTKSISDGTMESLRMKATKWFSIDAKWRRDGRPPAQVRTPQKIPKPPSGLAP